MSISVTVGSAPTYIVEVNDTKIELTVQDARDLLDELEAMLEETGQRYN